MSNLKAHSAVSNEVLGEADTSLLALHTMKREYYHANGSTSSSTAAANHSSQLQPRNNNVATRGNILEQNIITYPESVIASSSAEASLLSHYNSMMRVGCLNPPVAYQHPPAGSLPYPMLMPPTLAHSIRSPIGGALGEIRAGQFGEDPRQALRLSSLPWPLPPMITDNSSFFGNFRTSLMGAGPLSNQHWRLPVSELAMLASSRYGGTFPAPGTIHSPTPMAATGDAHSDFLAAYLGGVLPLLSPQVGRDGMLCSEAPASFHRQHTRLSAKNSSISNTSMGEPSQAGEARRQELRGMETFPMILHRALLELELVAGGLDIAGFLPTGDSFQVKKQLLFETRVLPLFFPKMKGFASFQRQLNLYDFKRVGGAGPDRGVYRHKDFLRAYPTLSSIMKRTKIKGGAPRRLARNAETLGDAEEGTGERGDRVPLVDGDCNAGLETNPSGGDQIVAGVLLIDGNESEER